MPIKTQKQKTTAPEGVYPDAYCVNCKSKKPTIKQQTVYLKNNSKAMKGVCANCGNDVYRFLGKNDKRSIRQMMTMVSLAVKTVIKKPKLPNLPRTSTKTLVNPRQVKIPVNRSLHSIHNRSVSRVPQKINRKWSRNQVAKDYRNKQISTFETVLLTLILALAAIVFVIGNAHIMLK